MKDLMVDIETLGKKPGFVVFEIAAVSFDPVTLEALEEFEVVIDVEDAKRHGMKVDPETVDWWEDHGGVITENARPLREALELFSAWVKKVDPKRVWSVGTCFERPMLEGALDAVGLPLPWHFSQGFDLRTEWKLAFPGRSRPRGSHRAVEDCRNQIKQLGEVFAARPLPQE